MSGITKKGVKEFQKTWSQNDVHFLNIHYGNCSVNWICEQLKKSKASVTVKAHRLGLTPAYEIDLFAPNRVY